MKINKPIIYLDNNATTKADPRVVEIMMPYIIDYYGNASSKHDLGTISNQAVTKSRNQIAELIGAAENEIFFTSGATESINLVLKGVVANSNIKTPHIITSSTEHPAVLDTCNFLETQGIKVTYLPVSELGLIDLIELKKAINKDTILISIMMVNNETGIIQPIKEIADIAHENNVPFMSDATQAVGKIPINSYQLGIDILCFSGHKFYCPKGIGGVFLRSKRPFKIKIPALIHGGGHEKGIRSGTLNVPGIVGIGEAAKISLSEMQKDATRIINLRDKLENSLLQIPGTLLNGHKNSRIYNTSNVCFEGADADSIITGLEDIMVSNGSACSSTIVEPSHVLKAMGKTDQDCYSSVRFSIGRFNTEQEILKTVEQFKKVIEEVRSMNV